MRNIKRVVKVLCWILGGWLVSGVGLSLILGKAIKKADEIELGDVDDC